MTQKKNPEQASVSYTGTPKESESKAKRKEEPGVTKDVVINDSLEKAEKPFTTKDKFSQG